MDYVSSYKELFWKQKLKKKETKAFTIEDCHVFKANDVNIYNKKVQKFATRNKAQEM